MRVGRRSFIKASAAAGAAGLLGAACGPEETEQTGFQLDPFVSGNPKAVFVHQTAVTAKTDGGAIRSVGASLAGQLIVADAPGGMPADTRVTIKPNWTKANPVGGKPVLEKLGVATDPNFVEGWLQGMKRQGAGRFFIRECSRPDQWAAMGYTALAKRVGADLRDLSSKPLSSYNLDTDMVVLDVPRGVVFKKIAFMAPMNAAGTLLINIAKLKAHSMGITGAVKNLQGITAHRLHNFCTPYDLVSGYEAEYLPYFHSNLKQRIEAMYAHHLRAKIPRWDRPGGNGGIWMEQWCQRMLDSLSLTPTGLNMVEGIYSQDGNGFGSGPHAPLGTQKITSRDYMSNLVLFGLDPVRVDIIAHWLAGHEPGNFGLFHLANERKMCDVLDPADIPLYAWRDGKATKIQLSSLKRTPLVTPYLRRDYGSGTKKEAAYHLCNEAFDYTAWKKSKPASLAPPELEHLGPGATGGQAFGLFLPAQDDVQVEVRDSSGEVVWRMAAEGLEPGEHHVVWDNFISPGMHSVYVKGMKWDAERRVMIEPERG